MQQSRHALRRGFQIDPPTARLGTSVPANAAASPPGGRRPLAAPMAGRSNATRLLAALYSCLVLRALGSAADGVALPSKYLSRKLQPAPLRAGVVRLGKGTLASAPVTQPALHT